jgi:hypothetical protein
MAGNHGGARPGAGRPKGSRTVRTKAAVAAEQAASAALATKGIDPAITQMQPLEVLLRAMWIAVSQGNWSQAASFAREASPYVHSKLSSVDLNATVKKDPAALTDAELAALVAKSTGQPVVIELKE